MDIPSAEEFLKQKPFINGMTREDQQTAMIEFTKLHVIKALTNAHKNHQWPMEDLHFTLSSYPLTNIV